MKNGNNAGFEQAYNAQAAVDQASRFIVACSLSNHANDKAEVAPTLAALAPELGTPPAAALDNGFWSEQNIAALEQRQIDPTLRQDVNPIIRAGKHALPVNRNPHRLMPAASQDGLQVAHSGRPSHLSLAQVHRRTCFDIVKAVLGFDSSCYTASLTSDEWCLMCLAYNIKRYHTLAWANRAQNATKWRSTRNLTRETA